MHEFGVVEVSDQEQVAFAAELRRAVEDTA
jgi:hypothetical protein